MNIFPIIIILATLVPDIIIWHHYISGMGIVARLLFCLPSLMILGSMWGFLSRFLSHNIGLRLFFGTILCLGVPKLIFAVVSWPFGWVAGLAAAVLVLLFFVYGFIWGWLRFEVTKETFVFPDLPESFDGYRILQVSDFHIGTFEYHPDFVERVVRSASELQPDLMVFTGDLINDDAKETAPFIETLSLLKAPDGVLSVLGNHDYADKKGVVNDERRLGWRLLLNEHVVIRRDDDSIAIVGVEHSGRPPFGFRGNLRGAVAELPDGSFKVLLSHDSSHWRMEVLDKSDIQLTLSGHTHAGQLKIGRFSPARFSYREWGGIYTQQGRILYVSSGLGGTLPFRLGAWPEINLITLRKQ